MREIRQSGSEGGVAQTNAPSLPLSDPGSKGNSRPKTASRNRPVRAGVERGESLLRSCASTGVFTPIVLQMIAVGEEAGSLDEMLEHAADFYEQDVEYDLQRMSAAIEPILILVLGGIVLVLALGVFLPIWDLGKAAMGRG